MLIVRFRKENRSVVFALLLAVSVLVVRGLQFLSNDTDIGWRISADSHLLSFHAKQSNLDLFSSGEFNNYSFSDTAGENEHDGLRANLLEALFYLICKLGSQERPVGLFCAGPSLPIKGLHGRRRAALSLSVGLMRSI